MTFLVCQHIAVALCILVLAAAFIKYQCKGNWAFINFVLDTKYTIIGVALGLFYCIY